jgi:hypothetical protein
VALLLGVLSAEFGIDPTGFGRLTGLARRSHPVAASATPASAASDANTINADAMGRPPPAAVK